VATSGLTLDDSARLLSHATWLERRLFEVLGAWAADTPEPAVKLAWARWSRLHAEHAALLEHLRPATRDHDVAQRGPLDAGWRTQVARMLAATTTTARLDRLLEVLDGARTGYEQHLAAMRPVRDAPVQRVLRVILDAERSEHDELEGLRRIDAGTGVDGR
jgi:hypothetical protein